MRSKCIPMLILAALFQAAAFPLSAQVHPSAEQGGWPLVVGSGYSTINMDWGNSNTTGNPRLINGVSVWAEWYRIPYFPRALGLGIKGEHVRWNQPADVPGLGFDAGLAGPIYRWKRYQRFDVFAKGYFGFGGLYIAPTGTNSHYTRFVSAPGVGGDVRVWNSIYVRADYEYQFWPHLFSKQHTLNPHGYTLGLSYDFSGIHRQY